MKKLFTLWFLLSPLLGLAQRLPVRFGFQYDQRPAVTINGRALLNPWAGGLNATQYANVRLNDDARDDLVVFDRTTNKISTFLAVDGPSGSGKVAWRYAPEYEAAFPAINSWFLLVDYDGDGRNDLFTSGVGSGVRVLRNESQKGQVAFRSVADPLMTFGLSETTQPIYVSVLDIPAVLDFDDDGDIDLITFDAGGNLIAYQQNMSVERTGKKDGLDFKRTGGQCWGHFYKEFCNDFIFGLTCDQGTVGIAPKQTPPNANPAGAKPQHSGNTLTVVDTDGDGNKDLLFGFVTCENIARLRSVGPNNAKVSYTGFDSLFPARNPILFPAFPATFLADVDGDGAKDLLASPNVSSNENFAFDFRASGWFYRNAGTNQKPDYQFVQKDFLQADMLDIGEKAAPALADLDGDGDMDLLVGVGYSGPNPNRAYRAGLWQFENRGTTQNPAFVLVTTDYLGLKSALALQYVTPSFVDVDANGSLDLVLTSSSIRDLEMRVLFNGAPQGAAVQYSISSAVRWPTLDLVKPGDLPTVTDVDQDGKPDLLVGMADYGTILYYRNSGTAARPTFQLLNQTFGGFQAEASYLVGARSLVISDLNNDRRNELISADNTGRVKIYQLPNQPDQPLVLLDSLPGLGLPGSGLMAAVADLDGDQLPELMLGSMAGGIRYLKNTTPKDVVTGLPQEPTGPWVFPNPTERYLTIRPPHDGRIELLSLSGQTMVPTQAVRAATETIIDLGSLPDGTYVLRLMADNKPALVQKVVVWK